MLMTECDWLLVNADKGHLPTNRLENISIAAQIYTKEAPELDVILDKGQNKVDSGTDIRDGDYLLFPCLNLFTNSVCVSYLILISLFLGF